MRVIIGGFPSSGSTLLFNKICNYFENFYLETGIFCNSQIYGSLQKNIFDLHEKIYDEINYIKFFDFNKSRDKNYKNFSNIILKSKNFLEKTPENIFFFNEIKSFDPDIHLIVTQRNIYDIFCSLQLRKLDVDFISLIIGLTSYYINLYKKIKIKKIYFLDYFEILNDEIILKKLNFLKNYRKRNIDEVQEVFMRTWKFNIQKKTNLDLKHFQNTADELSNYKLLNYFIFFNNVFYSLDGKQVENIDKNKIKEVNIKKFGNYGDFFDLKGFKLFKHFSLFNEYD